MSNYQKTIAARERAKRIREVRESILARISRREDIATIHNAMKFGVAGVA
jgi:hypothetical protein